MAIPQTQDVAEHREPHQVVHVLHTNVVHRAVRVTQNVVQYGRFQAIHSLPRQNLHPATRLRRKHTVQRDMQPETLQRPAAHHRQLVVP